MQKLAIVLALYAASALSGAAHAARATECTAINICYCVEQDLKGAIDTNVSKIRQAIAEQKSAGKALGYLSIPLSTVGGGYFGLNVEVAAKIKAAVEKRFGEKLLWMLNPGAAGYSLPSGANGADYMLQWTRVLEGPSGTGEDFDFFYFSGPSDFAQALGLIGEGDMEKIDALFDQRLCERREPAQGCGAGAGKQDHIPQLLRAESLDHLQLRLARRVEHPAADQREAARRHAVWRRQSDRELL